MNLPELDFNAQPPSRIGAWLQSNVRPPLKIALCVGNPFTEQLKHTCHEHEEKEYKKEYLSHTVRNLHFLSKNSTLISREILSIFFG